MLTELEALLMLKNICTSAADNAKKPGADPRDIIKAIHQSCELVEIELATIDPEEGECVA